MAFGTGYPDQIMEIATRLAAGMMANDGAKLDEILTHSEAQNVLAEGTVAIARKIYNVAHGLNK